MKKLIWMIVLIGILYAAYVVPEKWLREKPVDFTFDQTEIAVICDLATLRCTYHNVAEYHQETSGIFKGGRLRPGEKTLWIEYDSVIEYGIHANEVVVENPDANGVVRCFVPDAAVLNHPDIDKESVREYSQTAFLTSISANDEAAAVAAAQSAMLEEVSADNTMLTRAKSNAMMLIENYINKIGEAMGATLTVEWV